MADLVPTEPFFESVPRRLTEIPETWGDYDPARLTQLDAMTDVLLSKRSLCQKRIRATLTNRAEGELVTMLLVACGNFNEDDLVRAADGQRQPYWRSGWITEVGDEVGIRLTAEGVQIRNDIQNNSELRPIALSYAVGGRFAPPWVDRKWGSEESFPKANVRVERVETRACYSGHGGSVAAAQANVEIAQPISFSPIINVDSRPTVNVVQAAPVAGGSGPSGDPIQPTITLAEAMGTLKPCERKAYKVYCKAVEKISAKGIEPDDDRIWQFVNERFATDPDCDGKGEPPSYEPPIRASFFKYVQRAQKAEGRATHAR
jgi:hypothetical protein